MKEFIAEFPTFKEGYLTSLYDVIYDNNKPNEFYFDQNVINGIHNLLISQNNACLDDPSEVNESIREDTYNLLFNKLEKLSEFHSLRVHACENGYALKNPNSTIKLTDLIFKNKENGLYDKCVDFSTEYGDIVEEDSEAYDEAVKTGMLEVYECFQNNVKVKFFNSATQVLTGIYASVRNGESSYEGWTFKFNECFAINKDYVFMAYEKLKEASAFFNINGIDDPKFQELKDSFMQNEEFSTILADNSIQGMEECNNYMLSVIDENHYMYDYYTEIFRNMAERAYSTVGDKVVVGSQEVKEYLIRPLVEDMFHPGIAELTFKLLRNNHVSVCVDDLNNMDAFLHTCFANDVDEKFFSKVIYTHDLDGNKKNVTFASISDKYLNERGLFAFREGEKSYDNMVKYMWENRVDRQDVLGEIGFSAIICGKELYDAFKSKEDKTPSVKENSNQMQK